MNRFLLWLIPGILVLLVIGGLLYFRGKVPEAPIIEIGQVEETQQPERPRGFAQQPEPSAAQKAREDQDAMSAARHSGDLSDCEKITWDEELKQQCIDNLNYAQILNSDDVAQCSVILDEDLRQNCYDKLYFKTAVDERNLELCEEITDERLRTQCLDNVQSIISIGSGNPEDCANISLDAKREDCEDSASFNQSVENLDLSGCASISDPNLRAQCEGTITNNLQVIELNQEAAQQSKESKSAGELLAICDTLEGERETKCKDKVYPKLAFEEKDLGYCDSISDPEAVADCKEQQGTAIDQYYLRQAVNENDPALCQTIVSTAVRQTCIDSL